MPRLCFLGVSNAIPAAGYKHTHLACVGAKRQLLIDCVDNVIQRMSQAGLDALQVTDLLITHFHPDHASGVPSFLMQSWLMGRQKELNIFALEDTLNRIQANLGLYEWETWPGLFPVSMIPLPSEDMHLMIKDDDFSVYTSPVKHLSPCVGLRLEGNSSGTVVAYSSDTEPCESFLRLAKGAEIIIHEATGDYAGHTTPEDAGRIARETGAKSLYLIHYPTWKTNPATLVEEAKKTFTGEVKLAEELTFLSF